VHIFGASGSGTSSLARGLATRLSTQCFDTDDFFWEPGDPPFTVVRPVAARLDLMQQVFLPRRDWILSGSLMKWGDPVVARS
jgi:adenylate kinase family enzyme